MEQSVSGKSHGRFFKRLSQRFFLPYGALKKVQLSGRKRPTSGVFLATDQSQAERKLSTVKTRNNGRKITRESAGGAINSFNYRTCRDLQHV
jgi:hypothetical protein